MKKLSISVRGVIVRHRLLLLIVTGAVLLTGAYGVWSKNQWDIYQNDYVSWEAESKKKLDASLALPASNEAQQAEKRKALEGSADVISSKEGSICQINVLVGWQRFLAPLGEQEVNCRETRDKLVSLKKRIAMLTAYLANESELMGILKAVPAQAELSEGEWEAQIAAWRAIKEKVEKLQGQGSFPPVRDAARDALEKLAASWQGVLDAHKAQSRSQYTQAQEELTRSYGAFAGVTEVSTVQFDKVRAAFIDAYDAAF